MQSAREFSHRMEMTAAVLAAMYGGLLPIYRQRTTRTAGTQPCKHCGCETTHKKGCCSGDCYRAWKAEQKRLFHTPSVTATTGVSVCFAKQN